MNFVRCICDFGNLISDAISCIPGPIGWVGIGARTILEIVTPEKETHSIQCVQTFEEEYEEDEQEEEQEEYDEEDEQEEDDENIEEYDEDENENQQEQKRSSHNLQKIPKISPNMISGGIKAASKIGNCSVAIAQATKGMAKTALKVVKPGANHVKALTKMGNQAMHIANAGRGAVSAASKIASNLTVVGGIALNVVQMGVDAKNLLEDLFDLF